MIHFSQQNVLAAASNLIYKSVTLKFAIEEIIFAKSSIEMNVTRQLSDVVCAFVSDKVERMILHLSIFYHLRHLQDIFALYFT